jgi:late competence protein required for DNA uptake (superfamily II DNA/RNA helicase)
MMNEETAIASDSSKNEAGRVTCPFCGSNDNELFSLFGQTLIGSQYYCRNCRTVFEAVRWDALGPEAETKEEK